MNLKAVPILHKKGFYLEVILPTTIGLLALLMKQPTIPAVTFLLVGWVSLALMLLNDPSTSRLLKVIIAPLFLLGVLGLVVGLVLDIRLLVS